jgi:hypothetical protein
MSQASNVCEPGACSPKARILTHLITLCQMRIGIASPIIADNPGSAGRAPGKIIAAFAGVYARIASKLKVSPSFVSKVASGSRKSSQIEEALRNELRILKKDLARY